LTVTAVGADVAEHPLALVTVTLYDPAVVTVILCIVAPVLHKYLAPVLDVNITDPPAQNVVVLPAVIVAVGKAFTVTAVTAEVAEHPLALVTVTL
jgi:hypothetical protein